ncbi:MAG: HIT family hydrolase, partial [Solirubrobacterales bacterium]
MAKERIWAPWRLAYVKDASKDDEAECIFCAFAGAGPESDADNLVLHRGEHCFVVLNKFPYTNGHLLVAPYGHIGSL